MLNYFNVKLIIYIYNCLIFKGFSAYSCLIFFFFSLWVVSPNYDSSCYYYVGQRLGVDKVLEFGTLSSSRHVKLDWNEK